VRVAGDRLGKGVNWPQLEQSQTNGGNESRRKNHQRSGKKAHGRGAKTRPGGQRKTQKKARNPAKGPGQDLHEQLSKLASLQHQPTLFQDKFLSQELHPQIPTPTRSVGTHTLGQRLPTRRLRWQMLPVGVRAGRKPTDERGRTKNERRPTRTRRKGKRRPVKDTYRPQCGRMIKYGQPKERSRKKPAEFSRFSVAQNSHFHIPRQRGRKEEWKTADARGLRKSGLRK